jgi:hypothetical protein
MTTSRSTVRIGRFSLAIAAPMPVFPSNVRGVFSAAVLVDLGFASTLPSDMVGGSF